MDEQEAIKELKRLNEIVKCNFAKPTAEPFINAIEIGIKSIEKLQPQKPKGISVNEDGYRIGNCPNCGRLEIHLTDRCMCGQKLDWGK